MVPPFLERAVQPVIQLLATVPAALHATHRESVSARADMIENAPKLHARMP